MGTSGCLVINGRHGSAVSMYVRHDGYKQGFGAAIAIWLLGGATVDGLVELMASWSPNADGCGMSAGGRNTYIVSLADSTVTVGDDDDQERPWERPAVQKTMTYKGFCDWCTQMS